jgi:hypothetical protein
MTPGAQDILCVRPDWERGRFRPGRHSAFGPGGDHFV